MKKHNVIRLIVWVPLIAVVLVTGFVYAVEGLGFNPFFWSSTKIIDATTQINVPAEELTTWPVFTEPESGISFRYPPVLEDVYESRRIPVPGESTCTEILADTLSQPRPHSGAYIFYAPPSGYQFPPIDDSPPVDWMYATLPGEGDRMAVTIDCRPFEKQNITSIRLYWLNPEEVELGGRKGYRLFYHYDPGCIYEHYILPTSAGKIVRLSFNACKDSREVIRPYKQAILSTVKFNK